MDEENEEPTEAVRSIHLETMIKAALGGHDLGQWNFVDNGWRVQCRHCQKIIWIGDHHWSGFVVNHLDDVCNGRLPSETN